METISFSSKMFFFTLLLRALYPTFLVHFSFLVTAFHYDSAHQWWTILWILPSRLSNFYPQKINIIALIIKLLTLISSWKELQQMKVVI